MIPKSSRHFCLVFLQFQNIVFQFSSVGTRDPPGIHKVAKFYWESDPEITTWCVRTGQATVILLSVNEALV